MLAFGAVVPLMVQGRPSRLTLVPGAGGTSPARGWFNAGLAPPDGCCVVVPVDVPG